MVGVAPFVLTGVFSSTMQLRGRPGLEYSDAGLRGTRGKGEAVVDHSKKRETHTHKHQQFKRTPLKSLQLLDRKSIEGNIGTDIVKEIRASLVKLKMIKAVKGKIQMEREQRRNYSLTPSISHHTPSASRLPDH